MRSSRPGTPAASESDLSNAIFTRPPSIGGPSYTSLGFERHAVVVKARNHIGFKICPRGWIVLQISIPEGDAGCFDDVKLFTLSSPDEREVRCAFDVDRILLAPRA